MCFDGFVIEAVHHLDQSTIKHFEVIGLRTLQFVIDITVCNVFQRDTQVAFYAKAKFLDTTPYIPQRWKILMVTHAQTHQVSSQANHLPMNLLRGWHRSTPCSARYVI